MRGAVLTIALLASLLAQAVAQEPPPALVSSGQATNIALAAEDVLDELERAKIQILQLQVAYAEAVRDGDVCRAQIGPLRAEAASRDLTSAQAVLKGWIESRHKGYTWQPTTGKLLKMPDQTPATK